MHTIDFVPHPYSCGMVACMGECLINLEEVLLAMHTKQHVLQNYRPDDALVSCRTVTACVLWEITMQDLQPIVDWQEHVADMLVSISNIPFVGQT